MPSLDLDKLFADNIETTITHLLNVLNILNNTDKQHIKTILRQIYGSEPVLKFVKEKYNNFIEINIDEPKYQDILKRAVWNTITDMENSNLLLDNYNNTMFSKLIFKGKRKLFKIGFNKLISSVIEEGILEDLHSSILELDDSTRIELTKIFKDLAVQEALNKLMKSLLYDKNSAPISTFMQLLSNS